MFADAASGRSWPIFLQLVCEGGERSVFPNTLIDWEREICNRGHEYFPRVEGSGVLCLILIRDDASTRAKDESELAAHPGGVHLQPPWSPPLLASDFTATIGLSVLVMQKLIGV